MLDEKDLQAIAKLINTSVSESEARMAEKIDTAIGQSEARTAEKIGQSEARMMVMMESYFEPKFNLLEDQIRLIQEKLIPAEVQDETEARLDALEAVVRRHSREIEKLKKAQ